MSSATTARTSSMSQPDAPPNSRGSPGSPEPQRRAGDASGAHDSADAITLDDVVAHIRALPSLPAVVAELLASMEQEDIDVNALAGKIALDQALAAKTLRLSNSSFYGMQSSVTTIQQAVSVLGFHNIRTLVTACALTASFAPAAGQRFDFTTFWRHSVGTAACARVLAPHLRQHPETAFTCGLLHDLGTLVLATSYPERYASAVEHQRQNDCVTQLAERAVFGLDHAQVGSALAGHWLFPSAIQSAVAGHHDPDGGDTLALTIYLANALAHALDFSGTEDDQAPPLSLQAWRGAALSDAACHQIFRDSEQLFHDLCRILVN